MARKYPEDDLQMAAARYLDLIGAKWFHVANERKTTRQAGQRLKKKGVKSGIPDIIILDQKKGFTGLVIELKIKGNYTTENQKKWLKTFKGLNYMAVVAYNMDEVIDVVNNYFSI